MKFLIVTVCAQVFSIIIGLLIAFFDKKTCLAKSCKSLSTLIKNFIDNDVNPCDDFYKFACGKFLRQNMSQGILLDTHFSQGKRVKEMLKESFKYGEPKVFEKAKKFLKQCEKDKTSEEKQWKKVRKLFEKLGGFPTLDGVNWNGTDWTWIETTRKIRNHGLFHDALFTIGLYPNPRKITQTVLGTFTPSFMVQKDCENNPDCQEMLVQKYVKSLERFHVSKKLAEKDALSVFYLEKELFDAFYLHTEVTELHFMKQENVKTISNMIVNYDFLDWNMLVKILLQREQETPEDFVFVVTDIGYIESLRTTFQNSSKRVLANYMMWKILLNNIDREFFSAKKREKTDCFNFVSKNLTPLVQAMYMKRFPNPHGKDVAAVVEMCSRIQEEALKSIKTVKWMSDHAKLEGSAKIEHLVKRVGDLKSVNVSFVDEYYKGFTLKKSVFESKLAILKLSKDLLFEFCCGESFTSFNLNKYPEYSTGAYYSLLDNSINILHATLQNPIYDPIYPLYINYGRIGSVVGHEITHALDQSGRYYGRHGEIRDWWDDYTNRGFTRFSQCFEDQFDKFYSGSELKNNPNFSGRSKLLENVADGAGVKMAFKAYKTLSKNCLWPDLLLPGLDYSQDQLFFIGFASFWCTKANEISYINDLHSPNSYRVFETLQNNPSFNDVFGCNVESRNNLYDKCEIMW